MSIALRQLSDIEETWRADWKKDGSASGLLD